MGTNYYLHEKPSCEHCGRGYDALHVGKSSYGWCFSLHVIPDEKINGLDDWEQRWAQPGAYIKDEYDKTVSPMEMLEIITKRSHTKKSDWTWREYAENHAERGPNNLARHQLDGRHCIGHGHGTWDLITGEFS